MSLHRIRQSSNLSRHGIFVDDFAPKHSSVSPVFFLTHCHSDHLNGLQSKTKEFTTKWRLGPIYCSQDSALFLKSRFGLEYPQIITLALHEPITITLPSGVCITVTTFDANHCIGSIMFLFDLERIRILHTGDFRTNDAMINDIQTSLAGSRLDELIMDCTFCSPQTLHFPSTSDSIHAAISIIEKYVLKVSPRPRLYLACSALGTHTLMTALCSILNTRIYLQPFSGYPMFLMHSPSYSSLLSDNPNEGIWLKSPAHFTQFAAQTKVDDESAVFLLATTQFRLWSCDDGGNKQTRVERYVENGRIVCESEMNVKHVYYSMHSSLSEARRLVQTVKPRTLTPFCLPLEMLSTTTNHCMNKKIREMLLPREMENSRKAVDRIVRAVGGQQQYTEELKRKRELESVSSTLRELSAVSNDVVQHRHLPLVHLASLSPASSSCSSILTDTESLIRGKTVCVAQDIAFKSRCLCVQRVQELRGYVEKWCKKISDIYVIDERRHSSKKHLIRLIQQLKGESLLTRIVEMHDMTLLIHENSSPEHTRLWSSHDL